MGVDLRKYWPQHLLRHFRDGCIPVWVILSDTPPIVRIWMMILGQVCFQPTFLESRALTPVPSSEPIRLRRPITSRMVLMFPSFPSFPSFSALFIRRRTNPAMPEAMLNSSSNSIISNPFREDACCPTTSCKHHLYLDFRH